MSRQYSADALTGGAYAEGLSEVFYDCPPVKEFRRRYTLTRLGGKKPFSAGAAQGLQDVLGLGAKSRISRSSNSATTNGGSEYEMFRDYFRAEGYQSELVSPDQLEYRNGVLRGAGMDIDLIYRRVSVQEFLMRFTLDHPLVQAYRDRKVCIVNSFRSELSHKKAMFALLTDDALTAKFPPNERKAIKEHVPFTRVVKAGKTTWRDKTVDLIEFIRRTASRWCCVRTTIIRICTAISATSMTTARGRGRCARHSVRLMWCRRA